MSEPPFTKYWIRPRYYLWKRSKAGYNKYTVPYTPPGRRSIQRQFGYPVHLQFLFRQIVLFSYYYLTFKRLIQSKLFGSSSNFLHMILRLLTVHAFFFQSVVSSNALCRALIIVCFRFLISCIWKNLSITAMLSLPVMTVLAIF